MSAKTYIANIVRAMREICGGQGPAAAERGESGAALVEFTVLMPLFFLILFGIIEFGSMIWLQNTMASAAREGARSGAVQNSIASLSAATQKACARMAISSAGQTFAINASEQGPFVVGTTTYCEVTVNLSVPASTASLFNTFLSVVNGGLTASSWSGNISTGATMRGEDACGAPRAAVTCNCNTAGGAANGC